MLDHKKLMLFRFSSYGFLKNLRFFEPFLYLFFLANGLTYLQIGFLISIRETSTLLLETPTGIIADLTGRRKAMATAFASYIVSFIVFYFFSSFLLFIPAMLLFALGETFRSGTHKSMIMEHLDEEGMSDQKVQYYGKTRSASRLGSAVSAVLAGVIVYHFQSYNIVFLVTIFPYIIAFFLMLSYPKSLDGEPSGVSFDSTISHLKGSLRQFFDHPKLGKMMANASIYDSFFKISKDYLSPIIRSFAVGLPFLLYIENNDQRTAILVGVIYFFVYMNSFISSRKSASLMERTGNMSKALNLLYFIMASAFLAVAIFLYLNVTLLAIAAFFFFFTLYNLRKPMVVGYLGDIIEPDTRATLLSGHNQLRSVVGMIIAPILGFLADTFGISMAFFFGALVLIIIGLVLPVKEVKRRVKRDHSR
ncbi:MAG: MFS transporter [Candidatus Thermoplasmatota archaeon]|nr:MFS transporter [Candidatus Thermoplasmatota archaeon]